MFKLFTPGQATDLLPTVAPLLDALQDALKDLTRLQQERQTLRADSLRAQHIATEMAFIAAHAQHTKLALDRLGVIVSDIETGQLEFPSRLGAEMVYLCWQQGEAAVTYYHGLRQSVSAKQPLPDSGVLGSPPSRA